MCRNFLYFSKSLFTKKAKKSDFAQFGDVYILCSQQKNFQTRGKYMALKEGSLMSNIPKRNTASGCYLLRRNWSAFLRTTRCTIYVYPKSCAYHPDTECRTFFRGYLKNPKSSDNTMLTSIHVNNTHLVFREYFLTSRGQGWYLEKDDTFYSCQMCRFYSSYQ